MPNQSFTASKMPATEQHTRKGAKPQRLRTETPCAFFASLRLCAIILLPLLPNLAHAQFWDPNTSLILSTLREISVKHNLGLQEQRRQTATKKIISNPIEEPNC